MSHSQPNSLLSVPTGSLQISSLDAGSTAILLSFRTYATGTNSG